MLVIGSLVGFLACLILHLLCIRSPIGARHRADRADITERVGKL